MKLVNEIILYYDARSNEHQMNLINLRKKLVKCYTWSIAQYGAETWTLWKVDQKYLESFEMWYCRRMEISWTDHVKNEEVLHKQGGVEYPKYNKKEG